MSTRATFTVLPVLKACALLALLLLTCSYTSSDGTGTCRWSGAAPECGQGKCEDSDWYGIGNSTMDEDGNLCKAGVTSLYCCPKTRKPKPIHVKLCTGKGLQGDCIEVHETDTECFKLPENMKNKANSIDTFGGCVRLYRINPCYGISVALYEGNVANHTDLTKVNLGDDTESVGPCLRNDFCVPARVCRYPVEKFYVGWNPVNSVRSNDTGSGPTQYYKLGLGVRKPRTEYIYATIESKYLNTGTEPAPEESLRYLRSLGLKTDVAGMLLPPRLGGKGTDSRNLFPLTSDPNIHLALKTFEDLVYELVTKRGTVSVKVSLIYATDTDTRPVQIVFEVWISTRVLLQDSVPNPVFPILGSKPVPTTATTSTCRWSGEAPDCGNGICPDVNWFAVGKSTIDVDGRDCKVNVNNLYCCPKVRKPRPVNAKLCTKKDLTGDCFEIHESGTECVPLPSSIKNQANSVFTWGGCVRIYERSSCWGKSVALHQGNYANHVNLGNFNFGNNNAESVGPCFRNDFCVPSDACHFPFEDELCVGCPPSNTVESKDKSGGPVDYYKLGLVHRHGHNNIVYNSRAEFIHGAVERKHLDTGTQSTTESSEHMRSLGTETDVVGMLVPARLGGNGTDARNLFPLSSDPGTHGALKIVADIFYDLVTKHGKVFFYVNVLYVNPTDTRPIQLLYRVWNSGDSASAVVLFQDTVWNSASSTMILGTGTASTVSESFRTAVNPVLLQHSPTTPIPATIQTQKSPSTTVPSGSHDSSTSPLYYLIPGVLALILSTLPVCAFIVRKFNARNARNVSLELEVPSITPNSPPPALDDGIIIPASCVYIDRTCQLGEGEFATVYKGTFKAALVFFSVAVKVLKCNVSTSHRDAVIAEMNILAGVGLHPNVIRFYGAVADDYINKGQLVVVMEFCEKGCLHSLLVDSGRKVQKALADDNNLLNYEIEGAYVYRDLLGFSIQMASGMEHLEAKKIVHGDLATRNLLVNGAGVLKISDFGLSKQLVNYDIYMKSSQCPLPWRWMSPEALKHRKFSIKSDVWSFGVTLWEIFSYGAVPYPGLTWTSEFVELLENGSGSHRLYKPKFASIEIYDVIGKCLHADSERRPGFAELRTQIQRIFSKNWPTG